LAVWLFLCNFAAICGPPHITTQWKTSDAARADGAFGRLGRQQTKRHPHYCYTAQYI